MQIFFQVSFKDFVGRFGTTWLKNGYLWSSFSKSLLIDFRIVSNLKTGLSKKYSWSCSCSTLPINKEEVKNCMSNCFILFSLIKMKEISLYSFFKSCNYELSFGNSIWIEFFITIYRWQKILEKNLDTCIQSLQRCFRKQTGREDI